MFRYEDRYGSKKLPWKKWKIYKEQPKSVRKNQVETSTKAEIDGAKKGRMLIKSDLPRHLEVEVAKTIKANIPAIRRGSSLKGTDISRTVGRSENPGVPVLFDGHNLPPLDRVNRSARIWHPQGQQA